MSANLDLRKKRKADQRRKAILIFTLVCVFCISVTLSVLAFKYAVQNTDVAPANLPIVSPQIVLSPAPFIQITESSTSASVSTETSAVMPSQVELSLGSERLASMSLAGKIGQMIMVGVGGKELSPVECQLINEIMPGGIAFHGGNIANPEQLDRLITDLKNCTGANSYPPLFFALDHEGQYINRFESGVSIFPSALAQGATGDPSLTYQSTLASGQELSSMGINMILGPVADVLTNTDNLVIGERSFGGNSQQVGEFVASAVKGYRQAGLTPALKHFPGHGGVSVDSHNALPVDNSDLQTLSSVYFPPFRQGLDAGAPIVMLSHIIFPQIDPGKLPSSLSKPTVDLLRGQLGFNGVIMTDDLNMGALQGLGQDMPTIALESVRAGVDLLLILSLSDAQSAKNRIQAAVEQGAIPPEQIDNSALRILNLKAQQGMIQVYPSTDQPDWQANKSLAYDVGYRSTANLKNLEGLIPIPTTVKDVFIIVPPDNLGLDAVLNAELQAHGFQSQIAHYLAPWQGGVSGDDGMLQSFAAQAGNFDLTIVFTWQAHANKLLYEDNWQGLLVNTIQQNDTPLIVASLKSPTDILEFPSIRTYLASFGTTTGQIQALVDTLTGKSPGYGVNPLPQLP